LIASSSEPYPLRRPPRPDGLDPGGEAAPLPARGAVHAGFALLAAALAAVSLAGWLWGLPLLTSFVPGRPALSPMTAILILLAAGAACLLPARLRAAAVLAIAVALGGAAIVVSHGLGLPAEGPLPLQAWSSRLTGVMFLLSSASALLLVAGKHAAGQIVALGLLLFAALIGLGHVFPSARLYDFMPGTGVAIPSVLAFMAVSVSQLLVCRHSGITGALTRQSAAGRTSLRLLLCGLAAVLLLALVSIAARRHGVFDADTAVLLVAWGSMALLGSTLWSLAVTVARAERARLQAEQERDRVQQMVAAAVAHDLRNPLAGAAMATLLLQRLVTEPQQRLAVQKLERNHRRIDRLLRSLLDSLAVGSGRPLALHAVHVALQDLVAEVVEQSDSVLAQRVVCAGEAQGWWDRDALFRVLENLFLNAAKYGDADSPIACNLAMADEAEVVITVTNRGGAIPNRDWDTIFQPFTRGHNPGASEGWGIGLAYARAVAIGHGGSIRVAASGPSGTIFEIRLPADARAAIGRASGAAP
jgi:signal transduction histidine kinase